MDASSIIAAPATAPAAMPASRVLRAYVEEARAEILRYLRNPGFILPMLLFPLSFYTMFGIVMNHGSDATIARYILAAYVAFGVMAPGLFGFGVSLAFERENGLLTLKRALPMPPLAYLIGKTAMAVLMAGAVAALLLALGMTAGHVSLSTLQVARLLATGMLGVVPFCALGMLVGTLIKGQGGPGLINLVYLPMSFLSGLWLPLTMMPKPLQQLAPIWPSWHLHQIVQAAIGLDVGAPWPHVLALCGYGAAFLLLAARRMRRHG